MPNIRPISDLRNRAHDISSLCHDSAEPIFITKNGRSDLVVMSQTAYDRLKAKVELYTKLDEAHREFLKGDRGISHDEMMDKLRAIKRLS